MIKFLTYRRVFDALAEKLIDSSAKLAKAFGISEVVLGLTLLAYGTSLPEFEKGLGVSEWLIGATIVAAGTSLPELAVIFYHFFNRRIYIKEILQLFETRMNIFRQSFSIIRRINEMIAL
jgi:hypothetical protein